MEDGSEAAIKLLIREDQSGDHEFIVEVEMLSQLHHRNLVKLIGICIEDHTRCLVYELVSNGSVEIHLLALSRERALLVGMFGCRLLLVQRESNHRVIHNDLKASNILLEEDFTPKVSDFGLAREASEGSPHISTQVMGTFGTFVLLFTEVIRNLMLWQLPHLGNQSAEKRGLFKTLEYAMTGHLLGKSDVHSYGVVLLELLSGRKPVDMSQPQGQENLVTWARPLMTSREGLEQLVDPCLGGNYNFDNMGKVAGIASMCVNLEVTQRPFVGEVVQALKLVYNDMEETCEDSYSKQQLVEWEYPTSDFWVCLSLSNNGVLFRTA